MARKTTQKSASQKSKPYSSPVLPWSEALRVEVEQALRQQDDLPAAIEAIYKNFKLSSKKISLERFRIWAEQLPWRDALQVGGQIVRNFVGLEATPPGALSQQALKKILILLLRILDGEEIEITMTDLARISRVLAEQQRCGLLVVPSNADTGPPHSSRRGQLPPDFAETIRQIYGVDMDIPPTPSRQTPEESIQPPSDPTDRAIPAEGVLADCIAPLPPLK
ncbi:MAG: hypothetical protein HJJLKODD_02742 [Phycisphaerae bacterium]|nr:hypothetical protein [Phycisphaerae bacterium]